MLKYESTHSSPLIITQINSEPSVYLDHWALRKFSTTPELGDRLRRTLVERNGMLELSSMNILEFSEVTDVDQVRAVEMYLDSLSPEHIGFVNLIPKGVIELENKFLHGDKDVRDPHVDYRLVQLFAAHGRRSVNPASFEGLFSNQTPEMRSLSRGFSEALESHLSAAKQKAKKPEFAKIVHKTPREHPAVQFPTRYIEIETVRYIVRESIVMESNDWKDVYHMMVPLAYCNAVLLDSRWAAIATQVKGRLRKFGHTKNIADAFSSQTIEQFWTAIEAQPVQIGPVL